MSDLCAIDCCGKNIYKNENYADALAWVHPVQNGQVFSSAIDKFYILNYILGYTKLHIHPNLAN